MKPKYIFAIYSLGIGLIIQAIMYSSRISCLKNSNGGFDAMVCFLIEFPTSWAYFFIGLRLSELVANVSIWVLNVSFYFLISFLIFNLVAKVVYILKSKNLSH